MNGVRVTYRDKSFIIENNRYQSSDDFINFLTNPNITNEDIEDAADLKK